MTRTLLLTAFALLIASSVSAQSGSRSVVVNGERLNDATVEALEAGYAVRIDDGAYWYDPVCGAWGMAGGPTAGFILPGLRLGGSLRADASRGRTRVLVNGRRLPTGELRAFESLTGPIEPGRYWLDAVGNAGREGGPALVNLVQLSRQASRSGSGVRRSWVTGIGSNSSGGSGYVMGKDWSVSW